MELASGPKEEETHSDTTVEVLDNLYKKILSSKVTFSLFSIRLSMFSILSLVVVEIMIVFIFFNEQILKRPFLTDFFRKILYSCL